MTVPALVPPARRLTSVSAERVSPGTTGFTGSAPRMTFNLQISVAGSALPSEAAKVLRGIRELAEQIRGASANTGLTPSDQDGSGSVTVTLTPVTALSPSTMDQDAKGALWIEPASRMVVQDGQPVQLTRREFDLLLFLCENPRRVFSRDQLLSHVWGYEWVGGSRTVDVHVRRLRIKLGKHGPVVRTVHGVGYRLADDLDVRIGRPAR